MAARSYDWGEYVSDNGNVYVCKLELNTRIQGGFSDAAPPPAGSPWPWNTKDLRHVTGRSEDGKSGRLPVASPTDPLFRDGGNWIDHEGTEYTVTGAHGENRASSHLGG